MEAGNIEFQKWLDAGVALAEETAELRQVMADTLGFMGQAAMDDKNLSGLTPIIDVATDKVVVMLGPLAPVDGCLTCGGHKGELHPVGLCVLCAEDYGTDPEGWPDWVKRIAQDRAQRLSGKVCEPPGTGPTDDLHELRGLVDGLVAWVVSGKGSVGELRVGKPTDDLRNL